MGRAVVPGAGAGPNLFYALQQKAGHLFPQNPMAQQPVPSPASPQPAQPQNQQPYPQMQAHPLFGNMSPTPNPRPSPYMMSKY